MQSIRYWSRFLTIIFFLLCLPQSVFSATIDIMVVFDTTAKTWVDKNGGMNLLAVDAVARLNQATANSNVNLTFRLAHAAEVSYTHDTLSRDLSRLQAGTSGLSVVHSWRTTHGADVVVMLVDTGSASGTVGSAYMLTSYAGEPDYAFSVCAIRSVDISHTMTHEVGHNLGCDHSKFQTSDPGPNTYLNTYSAGWYFTGTNLIAYNTIMAYSSDGYGNTYIEAPLFSTPLESYQGTVAGDAADGDNSRNIRETMDIVAAYLPENISEPDPFTFVDQTDVPLSTVITSNEITVSGLNAAAIIYISGGTYSINGGTYTNAEGTVINGDTVTVQLISSESHSTTTGATLTIGSVSDTFSVTTEAALAVSGGGGGGGCFIATAAFDSPLAGQVDVLRQFRDRYLLTNSLGRKFVAWYYRVGPVAASYIKDKPLAKAAVRVALYPLVGFSLLLIHGIFIYILFAGAALFFVFRFQEFGGHKT